MPVNCFHDGRILIVTIAAPTTPEELASAGPALRAHAEPEAQQVLLDARLHGPAGLTEALGGLLGFAERSSRWALLLSDEQYVAQAAGLRLMLREHGPEAEIFDSPGPALRWVWCLDEAAPLRLDVPRERARASRRARSARGEASQRSQP